MLRESKHGTIHNAQTPTYPCLRTVEIKEIRLEATKQTAWQSRSYLEKKHGNL